MNTFLQECAWIYRHKGVLTILMAVPIIYSMFYPLPYEQAVVKEVPTIVWDDEGSETTRDWIFQIDASPKLDVIAVLPGEPNQAEFEQFTEAQFFAHFPANSSEKLAHQQQVDIPFGGKTDNFLVYSTAAGAFANLVQQINTDIRLKTFYQVEGNAVSANMSASPISANISKLYNEEASYYQYLVPAVFVMIVHQILVMAMGMHWGYRFEMNRPVGDPFKVWASHLILYSLQGWALIIFFFRLILPAQGIAFNGDAIALLNVSIPFILGAVGFGMVVTAAFKEQETALIWCIPLSVPLLMISGISWPNLAMQDWISYLSQWLPSTWGVNALIDVAYVDHQPPLFIGWRNAIIWLSLGLLARYWAVERWQRSNKAKTAEAS